MACPVEAMPSDVRGSYSARGLLPSTVPSCQSEYGQSHSSRDLLALADHLGLDRFHLVGLSMGSFTSLLFAFEPAARLCPLTLAGCTSGPRDEEQRTKYREDIAREIEMLDAELGDGAVRWFAEDAAYARMPEKQPVGWREDRDNLRAQSVPGAKNTFLTLHWNCVSIYESSDEHRMMKVPTLLIYGDEDHPLIKPTNKFLEDISPTLKVFVWNARGTW